MPEDLRTVCLSRHWMCLPGNLYQLGFKTLPFCFVLVFFTVFSTPGHDKLLQIRSIREVKFNLNVRDTKKRQCSRVQFNPEFDVSACRRNGIKKS